MRLGLALLLTSACNSSVGAPMAPIFDTGAARSCEQPQSGPAPMRRLTNIEWAYTAADLLGQTDLSSRLAAGFVAEPESLGFHNAADFLEVPVVLAEQYMSAAEQLAERAVTDLGALLPCQPVAGQEAVCARRFIESFGRRAYRRPLAAQEIERYAALAALAQAEYGLEAAIEWVIYAMLQSPHFLHRVEIGTGGAIPRPDPYETATRLSYLYWLSAPDEVLLDAAANGELESVAQIRVQAERLLADPKARRLFRFFEEWLDLDALAGVERNAAAFPTWSPALGTALRNETEAFVGDVLWGGDGRFETLLSAPHTFVDPVLAEHYRIAHPGGTGFRRVELDPSQRAGLLTQGGVLAVHDRPTRTSIVRRGLKVRIDLFCHIVGSPPDDVVLDLPELSSDMTQRERLELHRTEASCAQCHDLMDPIGVAFEALDPLGRWRAADENGAPVVSDTEIEHTADADGPVSGAAQLAQRLARSDEVRACFATQLFRWAFGRGETNADACSLEQLNASFAASDYSVSDLLLSLTSTDAFLFRPGGEP